MRMGQRKRVEAIGIYQNGEDNDMGVIIVLVTEASYRVEGCKALGSTHSMCSLMRIPASFIFCLMSHIKGICSIDVPNIRINWDIMIDNILKRARYWYLIFSFHRTRLICRWSIYSWYLICFTLTKTLIWYTAYLVSNRLWARVWNRLWALCCS